MTTDRKATQAAADAVKMAADAAKGSVRDLPQERCRVRRTPASWSAPRNPETCPP